MTSIRSGDASFANCGNASSTGSAPSGGGGGPTSPLRRLTGTSTPATATQPLPNLDDLLFKATNPSNKLEDVNTIKQFCDAVNATPDGAAAACRLLAHKIQSPQEREAVQALAVLEACVKSCGPLFHSEVGKFKFLNEMIKLVSPRYLAGRTPEHIKKKVIEMLFVWTQRSDLKGETKISEAYTMLKSQGIVKEDPIHVGEAVFASALPPRQKEPLSQEDSTKLRKLLQSKNPEDLKRANRIIKGMVQEDERKMDAMSRRHTELTMVKNNSRLLTEMMDHWDSRSSGPEERDLLKELHDSCVKMQPKLLRLAAESTDTANTSDGDSDDIVDILAASDDLAKVIERYRTVVVDGKPDTAKTSHQTPSSGTKTTLAKQNSELLLELDLNAPPDSEYACNLAVTPPLGAEELGEDALGSINFSSQQQKQQEKSSDLLIEGAGGPISLSSDGGGGVTNPSKNAPTIDDLLMENGGTTNGQGSNPSSTGEAKSSRQRGLDELDFLGESAIKSHLPQKSPQFVKKNSDKVSLNTLQEQKRAQQQNNPVLGTADTSLISAVTPSSSNPPASTGSGEVQQQPSPAARDVQILDTSSASVAATLGNSSCKAAPSKPPASKVKDVKIADLEVSISSIKPGSIPPLTLSEGSEEGISIVLHFGQDQPRESVTAIVVTIISKMSVPVSDFELKAVVPKGCKVKLQAPSARDMPAHNPFVPPSAITQVMLIANPSGMPVSFKYVLSYLVDGEPQTDMGEVERLPI